MAIIGVVAALTVPTLITNYQKNQYVTQLKKNYNILSNGFRTMMADEGVGKLTDTTIWRKIPKGHEVYYSDNSDTSKAISAELSKTFATVNLDAPSIDYHFLGTSSEVNSAAHGIVLKDGTIVDWAFYNNNYKAHSNYPNMPEWVGTIMVDVNGVKKPNIYGRDYFGFELYNDGSLHGSRSEFYSKQSSGDLSDLYTNGWCDTQGDIPGGGFGCSAKIMAEGWKMNY